MHRRSTPVLPVPPRRRPLPAGALRQAAVAALLGLAGCSSPIPAVMVRLENHQVQPVQSIGLISEGHPDHPDPMDLPPATKPAPPELMEKILELLGAQGFDRWARPEPAWPEAVEPLPILRRLLVDVEGQTRSMVVPRSPDPELAACFSTLARAIGASFNEIEFMRVDRVQREPLSGTPLVNPMEAEQERLRRENERKRRDRDR